jgi:hypothetical protein
MHGVEYPFISREQIPKGIVSVLVTIENKARELVYKVTMVAGSVEMTAKTAGDLKDQTSVQPRSGWWMLEDSVASHRRGAKKAALHIP